MTELSEGASNYTLPPAGERIYTSLPIVLYNTQGQVQLFMPDRAPMWSLYGTSAQTSGPEQETELAKTMLNEEERNKADFRTNVDTILQQQTDLSEETRAKAHPVAWVMVVKGADHQLLEVNQVWAVPVGDTSVTNKYGTFAQFFSSENIPQNTHTLHNVMAKLVAENIRDGVTPQEPYFVSAVPGKYSTLDALIKTGFNLTEDEQKYVDAWDIHEKVVAKRAEGKLDRDVPKP